MPYLQEYEHCDRCKGDYPVGHSKVVKAWQDAGGWTFVDSIVHLCDKCYNELLDFMNQKITR